MITEAKFKHALKEMMEDTPLEEINVTALCEKCGCHRQTFYYHFQDIYDLIAAILLNDDLSSLNSAKDNKKALQAFAHYVKTNFRFLQSTYNSAGRDLTDDFIFGKLHAKFFSLWSEDITVNLKTESIREASRRFAHYIADEFGYWFKDQSLTPEKFAKKTNRFIDNSIKIVLPAIMEASRKEERA